jgi:hypothetical protein
MKTRSFLPVLIGLLLSVLLSAESPAALDSALREKVDAAIAKGLAYLDKEQKPEGFWSSRDYPGLTGLAVQAYLTAPEGKIATTRRRAKAWISFARTPSPTAGCIRNGWVSLRL